ncbi:hypothetical protein WJX72_010329 [[Myrmecia] bisecta]|uniref:Uncharacterized protein n=1 Tax=[Myrmecia] bisecta TaxID=41462 RepID=A0AAW1PKV9_9CHLO
MLSQSFARILPLPASATAAAEDGKQRNLPIQQLKRVVAEDFSKRQYYITGKLTPAIYANDCTFKDPTTNVKGVKPYTTAVATLFDPATSRADLISLEVKDPHTLLLNWRLEATLKVPGSPKIKPYTGHTRYITNSEGLIQSHLEDWDISALDAFVSVLFPGFGAPPAPPVSHTG